jgi:hypothetical protein
MWRIALSVLVLWAGPVGASERQSLQDAWWTGPLLAAGAATLPKGRVLVEPYLFDVVRYGRYDAEGDRQNASRSHGYRSLTYLLYGVTDKLTAGVIPVFGFNNASLNGGDSSGLQLGDLTVQGQYRLSQFREGSWLPTSSLVVQQSLPVGKYDRLGANPGDGLGTGAYTTTVSLRTQYFLWMPNGRILRTRFHVSHAVSDDVSVEDVSVYGTSAGFRGRAEPGAVTTINSSWEYSITRNWVLALDFVYQHDAATRLTGLQDELAIDRRFAPAWRFGSAVGIEYNFSSTVGVIVGARWYAAGRNTNATVTPLAAINLVF